MTYSEMVDWLKTLIAAYTAEHDWDSDEDTASTQDMIWACVQLHSMLCNCVLIELGNPDERKE